MGKFGHKNMINLNPLAYNIGLLGESGIGKSTIMKEICEKLAGEDGYLALDIGKEDGHKAIAGINTERVEDWSKFREVVDDIVANKDEDYPNLQVVIIDTYDQLCDLAEKEAVRLYNNTEAGRKQKALTINSAWGGFGRGLDKAVDLMLDALWELKSVGVSFIIVAHVKRTDITDVFTEETYSMLTSNTTQRYFNAIKQKLDFLGMGYIDREIVKEKTKKKDKDGNLIEKGKVASESRVINFRDDTYSTDSKSRFANIIPKIPFDADAFIKAMQDAILAEQEKSGETMTAAKKRQKATEEENAKKATEYSKNKRENEVDPDRNAELVAEMSELFVKLDDDAKAPIKTKMKELGMKNFQGLLEYPTKQVEEIRSLFG